MLEQEEASHTAFYDTLEFLRMRFNSEDLYLVAGRSGSENRLPFEQTTDIAPMFQHSPFLPF